METGHKLTYKLDIKYCSNVENYKHGDDPKLGIYVTKLTYSESILAGITQIN